MTVAEFKGKAEKLLNEYIENKDNASLDWQRIEDIKDEFLHLVYFFSPNIPMLKEMQTADVEYPGFTKYGKRPEKYMKRFIHYIDEFCKDE